MRWTALATDYDGTIAHDGLMDEATVDALTRLKASGRRLIMVTGRELAELKDVCKSLGLFDLVVAENGAVLYDPEAGEEVTLAPTPSEELVARLRAAGVPDISVGRSIVALWKPHEVTALEVIRDLGLELHIVFNKQAVMILPSAISKATGLAAACGRLGLEAENIVGIGDAENDHAFIEACGFGVAVANAIPSLKERADLVTQGERGAGAAELIELMLADDLASLAPVRPAASGQARG